MRYVPMKRLSSGMVVKQDIYSGEGNLILEKEVVLDDEHINTLIELGLPGIYVNDGFAEDIPIEQIIRPEIRAEALKLVHEIFAADIENPPYQEDIEKVVLDIVREVTENKNVMCNLLDMKTYDDYTYFHCVNVAVLSAVIGISSNLSEKDVISLTTAAILHDVGKRFVEREVLNARRRLTEEERRLIIQHPKLGYEFLRDHYEFSSYIYTSVLQHHEWYNGEGYPLRRSGSEIPLYARIIKIADVYDAFTSKLPYREPKSPSEAAEYLMNSSGGEFDPELLETFMKKISVYPVGCEVTLSDGRRAIVVENFEDAILRPKVKLTPTGEVMNLKEDAIAKDISIIELLV